MVHLSNNRNVQIIESDRGLYYYDMAPLISKPATMGAVIYTTIHSRR